MCPVVEQFSDGCRRIFSLRLIVCYNHIIEHCNSVCFVFSLLIRIIAQKQIISVLSVILE